MAELPPDLGELMPDQGDGPYFLKLDTSYKVPDGWYVKISLGHGISGVLVNEQAGEIRIPFEGKKSCLLTIAALEIAVEHRGTMIAGQVIQDA